MEGFFGKVGECFSNMFRNVKRSFKDSGKKMKLRSKVNELETEIRDIKIEMGTKIHEAYLTGDDPEDFTAKCKRLDFLISEAKENKVRLLAMDGIKICADCGLEIPFNAQYCQHCGEKQPNNAFSERSRSFDDDDDDDDYYDDDIEVDSGKKQSKKSDADDDGYISIGMR